MSFIHHCARIIGSDGKYLIGSFPPFDPITVTTRPRPKKQADGRDTFLPENFVAPVRTQRRAQRRRNQSHHPSGFAVKKVRTSIKNVSNFAENSKSPEKGEMHRMCGGRGGIPPQTPPAAPPAFCLAFLGSGGTRAKGMRGEKTRARSRTRGFSPP